MTAFLTTVVDPTVLGPVSCPAKMHCVAVFALQNGKCSKLALAHPPYLLKSRPCLSRKNRFDPVFLEISRSTVVRLLADVFSANEMVASQSYVAIQFLETGVALLEVFGKLDFQSVLRFLRLSIHSRYLHTMHLHILSRSEGRGPLKSSHFAHCWTFGRVWPPVFPPGDTHACTTI